MSHPVVPDTALSSSDFGRDEVRLVARLSKETNMASKAKTISGTEHTQPEAEVERGEELPHSTRDQDIRNRAYGIYLQRGEQPGYELEDWLQAERELSAS